MVVRKGFKLRGLELSVKGEIQVTTSPELIKMFVISFHSPPFRFISGFKQLFYLPLFGRAQFNGCNHYLEKCCKNEDIRSPTAMKSPAISTKCGVRNLSGVGFRHLNVDNEAQYAEFPWVVGVVGEGRAQSTDGSSSSAYLCGGSLIHPQVVLTAAHRVKGYVCFYS